MSNFDVIAANKDLGKDEDSTETEGAALVSWVMERVQQWESWRNTNYRQKWNEYYRLWRGLYSKNDSTRDSERSRLISPALSQAIESAVAELEEASFGNGKWYDVDDDYIDKDKQDVAQFRDQMREELNKANVPANISEIFLNGAIYGTGIGKIVTEEVVNKVISQSNIGDSDVGEMSVEDETSIEVSVLAVHPQEFVIDPTARTIDDALGMAHITQVPRHAVEKKQTDGVYNDVMISNFSDSMVGDRNLFQKDEIRSIRDEDKVMLIEYHGLIPRALLPLTVEEEDAVVSLFDDDETNDVVDESDLVEAIVTIANSTTLLRGIENPFKMKDRCFVAYQHDTVPNRFWGRGVAEKGYNPQKALDAELRGRIDAMALSIHPMMGVDATRIPRGGNFKIAPGRNVFTNGDPSTILKPFNFGQVNPTTFTQGGDLERQVQMGTGSMDSATPIGENRRNETSSGMSMIMGGAIKRSKRTLSNIERTFMRPLIHKAAWRFMQFAPDKFPAKDIKFVVHSTLGLVAKELETQQLSNMMNTVPPESPAFWMLLKAIYEHSTISNREEMLGVIEQMMQQSIKKQSEPEQEDPLIALKKQEIQVKAQIEQKKIEVDQQENQQEAQLELAKLQLEQEKLQLKREEIMLNAKIQLAEMEQDSAVTLTQVAAKAQSDDKAHAAKKKSDA